MKTKVIILILLTLPFFTGAQVQISIGNGVDMMIGVDSDVTVGTSASSGLVSNSNTANLVINSNSTGDGSLICGGTPNATVERYIGVNAWHNVTPITTTVTARDFYLGHPNMSWLVFFTESDEQYHYVVDLDSTLPRGVGYAYWIKDGLSPQTVSYKGQLTGSDVSVNLKKSLNGWNLIGNPFPSALDWSSSSIDHTTNITGTAYVWSQSDGGYLYSTTGSGTHSGTVGTLPNDIIPLGQGFFVQANSDNVNFTIPAAARVHNHTDPFLKASKSGNNDSTSTPNTFIRIDIDGGYYGNTVFVGFPKNGTKDFDIGSDATKLFSSTSNIQFYAGENGRKLCVNANPPLETTDSATVPLYIIQATGKKYTMKFSMLNQLPDVSITLEDLKLGKIQDIRETPTYSFTSSNSDITKRFLLHFKASVTGINHQGELSEGIHIYSYAKDVFVRSSNKFIGKPGIVYIYDLLGRKLLERSISGSGLMKIPVNISSGYVVVRVTRSGTTLTQKVYIQ